MDQAQNAADPNAALDDAKVFFLFPTCVWQHDLKPDDAQAIKATILPKIEELLTPREETMRDRVWQTHHDLHKLEEFAGLLGFVDLAADGVLKFLQVDYKDIEITGCWANVNPTGTDHHPHIHPNNFLSGVYYAQVPRDEDGLFLYDPRPQTSIISPKVRQVTDYTCNSKMMPIKEGRMFIFPAWLQHSVKITGGVGERVSISFNIMFTSFTQDYSPPRWRRRPSV
ncbi:MAG: TIGR02466 family protein [Pseudomonadota bacterium]